MPRDDGDQRIQTWAAIGDYIGRDARTAQRYGATAGLPVHRLADARGSAVYALRSELDEWLARRGAASADPPAPAAPTPSAPPERRGARAAWVAGLVLVLLVAAGTAIALRPRPGGATAREVVALYQKGLYAWSRRTPEGLSTAIDAFTQAVVRDPSYAPAYAGLADAYDLAPEFGRLPPAEAYPRAKAAAERALRLDPSSAAAHRALAFVEFWWEGRVAPAMAEFRRALELDPRSAQTHHWYANALAARGDARALAELDAAAALSPSTPIMADRAWALAMLGRPAEALTTLAELRRLDASFPAAGPTDVLAAKRLGRDADMLEAMRLWARVRGDPEDVGAVERLQALYAREGEPALRQGLAEREETRLAQGRGDPITAAAAEMARGRDRVALALLQRAKAERSPVVLSLAFNPDFSSLRDDARFRALTR